METAPRRALIVQDEPELRRSLRAIATACGFTLIADVAAADDAIEVAAATHPDVILLDLDLAGRRGVQLITALLSTSPNCVLLVLSSFDSLRFAALEAGAFAVVGKSDLRDLRRSLERLKDVHPGPGPAPTDD